MFKTKESTPRYYTNTSRDFQLLGHLLDCVVSNVRQGVNGIANIPFNKNIDTSLLSLTQTTLGLNLTHKYSSQSLLAICSNLKHILSLKGSKSAIEESVKTLLNSQNLKEEYNVSIDNDNYIISIRVPKSTQELELLDDLLNYVVPVGYTYSIIKSKLENTELTTYLVERGNMSSGGYTSYNLHKYSTYDSLMSDYNFDNMSEVGMTTVVSAKDLTNKDTKDNTSEEVSIVSDNVESEED